MASCQGVGGIEPSSSAPRPARVPSPRSPLPSPFPSRGEEGEEFEEGDYYDIMIVGITGQGKSTTADKMIIASSPVQRSPPDKEKSEAKKITEDNITFWSMGDVPEDLKISIVMYLKRLTLYRCLVDPHLNVNEFYEQEEEQEEPEEDEKEGASTSTCQLISNDITGIRVLDVPGFFNKTPDANPSSGVHSSRALESNVSLTVQRHLMVMRSILRIQSTMKMRFRRILYFLPVRGPLQKRRSEVLMQELQLLALYFGKCVFECMILVATLPTFQKDACFPEKELQKTQIQFRKALKDVLQSHCNENAIPSPPVIFISMVDKCEQIVEKVKNADVAKDSLELTIHPGICVKCSSLIKWLGDERVECIPVGKTEEHAIPFCDSLCHPIFIPKNGTLQTIEMKDQIPYIVISKKKGQRMDNSEEICLNCGRAPGTEGCLKVDSVYKVDAKDGKSEYIDVDHTNRVERHRRLSQSIEPEDKANQPPQAGPPEIGPPPDVPRASGRIPPAHNQDSPQHRIVEVQQNAGTPQGSSSNTSDVDGAIDIPRGRKTPHQGSGAVDEESSSGPEHHHRRHHQERQMEGSSLVNETSDGYLSAKLVSGNKLSHEVGGGVWSRTLGKGQERTDNQQSLLDEAGFADMKGV